MVQGQHVQRLGNQPRQPDAQKIFGHAAGVVEAYHQTPAVQGKGHPPQHAHFQHPGKEHLSRVIHKHQRQGYQLEHARGSVARQGPAILHTAHPLPAKDCYSIAQRAKKRKFSFLSERVHAFVTFRVYHAYTRR